MAKLNVSKEELQALYEEELDCLLEQCDWITYIKSETVCSLITQVLSNLGTSIDAEKLHEAYTLEVDSMNLKDGEWVDKYGVKEIISVIYDILEKKF